MRTSDLTKLLYSAKTEQVGESRFLGNITIV